MTASSPKFYTIMIRICFIEFQCLYSISLFKNILPSPDKNSRTRKNSLDNIRILCYNIPVTPWGYSSVGRALE